MNKLVETIDWAALMGFTVRRSKVGTGHKVSVYINATCELIFWFDEDYDLDIVERL